RADRERLLPGCEGGPRIRLGRERERRVGALSIPSIGSRQIQLPEELGMYVDAPRKEYPSIDEVWLLGPRVNDERTRGSEWELLAFGNKRVLDAIRAKPSLPRDDLKLMIVIDGDRFEPAWGGAERGRLSSIGWRVEDLHSAS